MKFSIIKSKIYNYARSLIILSIFPLRGLPDIKFLLLGNKVQVFIYITFLMESFINALGNMFYHRTDIFMES